MTSENRQIIVESNDPRVTYVGEWTTVQRNSNNEIDPLRFISFPTIQSTKTNSSFSFSFEGSAIFVFGILNGTSNTGIHECIIDGVSFGFSAPASASKPILKSGSLCGGAGIPDGTHELAVNIVSDGVATFYMEYLTYSPSLDVSRENSFIAIDGTDPAINYISGWTGSTGATPYNQTTDPNGLVNVTFVGVQLSWYRYIGAAEPNATVSSGEYSVDGKPFASFQIPTSETAGNQDLFPLLFDTPSLEMGLMSYQFDIRERRGKLL
ncbi:hypothetical protein Clacol_002088 [Clathrus columnatus]|uniref:Uncharacterized protein n=1 Tax=Clathrus columnatus TaxID=1419009 RepID=A0AAV5A2N6_9AGAM|nr:hypothetical protein Clacol_002088 [Clathrus columnatus]